MTRDWLMDYGPKRVAAILDAHERYRVDYDGRSMKGNLVLDSELALQAGMETEALMKFFDATGGPNWFFNTYWGQDPVCVGDASSWFGVGCTGGAVTALVMSSNNLTGVLSADFNSTLGRLSYLQNMDLSKNSLSGPLPDLSGLVQLQYVSLDSNPLLGTLPSNWSRLTSLSYLSITGASIYGPLPSSWANMSFGFLALHTNQLSGTLPSSWALQSITQIFLNNNNFTGALPDSWSSWSQVISLALSYNQLDGTLPNSWSSLTKLQGLFLFQNSLTGTLPNSWSSFVALQTLYVYNNNLVGTLPSSWSTLTNLYELGVNSNHFEGTLPVSWHNMSTLSLLRFDDNHLTGTLPEEYHVLTQLFLIGGAGNNLNGTLPSVWSHLPSLSSIGLLGNKLTGTLPESWGSLTVNNIELQDNQIEGSIPNSYVGMGSLQHLLLRGNRLSSIESLFSILPPKIESCDLSFNNISGEFPSFTHFKNLASAFVSIDSLSSLSLAGNPHLVGTLPHCYFQWDSAMLFLNISYTGLTGTIPDKWNLCLPALVVLDIRGTELFASEAIITGNGSYLKRIWSWQASTHQQCPRLEATTVDSAITVFAGLSFFNYTHCPCAQNYYGVDGVCFECQWAYSDCSNGFQLLVRPDFWGVQLNATTTDAHPTLQFSRCPEGRCCINNEDGCPLSQVCTGSHRSGSLCGNCEPNYSQPWGSDVCQPNSACWAGWLVILLLISFALCYVSFLTVVGANFIGKEEAAPLTGWKSVLNTQASIPILVYFYQIAPLLRPTSASSHTLTSTVHVWLVSLFRLELSGGSLGICVFPNFTAIDITLFSYTLPAALLFWIFVFALCGLFVQRRSRDSLASSSSLGSRSSLVGESGSKVEWAYQRWLLLVDSQRLMHALSVVTSLAYIVLLERTLSLLHCEEIGGQLRLFISGDIVCWQSAWQWAMLIPTVFLVLLPLVRMWMSSREWGPLGSAFVASDRRLCREGCWWWPGALLLQRLVFVAVHTVVTSDIVLRAWINALLCACGVLLASVVKPYRVSSVNIADLCCRMLLSLLSLGPIAFAQLLTSGATPDRLSLNQQSLSFFASLVGALIVIPALWYLVCYAVKFLVGTARVFKKSRKQAGSSGQSYIPLKAPLIS